MSEREERLSLEISVCMAFHVVVIEVRKVSIRRIECHRKASRRVVVAEENVSDRLTTGLSAVPCLKDGVAILSLRCESHG